MSVWGERPEWHALAACRGMTVAMFPGRGQETRAVKALCEGCPVKAQCLAQALANHECHGVWGGTSEHQRRTMRRDVRGRVRTAPSEDGRSTIYVCSREGCGATCRGGASIAAHVRAHVRADDFAAQRSPVAS